jgi:hypothetical protein
MDMSLFNREDNTEKRSAARSPNYTSYSVEFSLSDIAYAFQFKLMDTSPTGLSILVNRKSGLLEKLMVGAELNMKLYKPDTRSAIPQGFLKTETRHITETPNGNYIVGFLILQKEKFRSGIDLSQ